MASEQRLEEILFEKALKKVHVYLKPIGLKIDYHDRDRTIWERLRIRWLFLINIMWINTDVIGQIVFLVHGEFTGQSFLQLTNLAPCLGLCFLGNIQSFYFVKRNPQICELIDSIRALQVISAENEMEHTDVKFLKRQIKIFYIAINSLTVIKVFGLAAFGISPFINIAINYYSTGEVKLIQPFSLTYPFDITDIRFWPIVYVYEMGSAIIAVLTVLAPCYLCYACSTFIIFQFYLLKNDLENLIPYKYSLDVQLMDDDIKRKIKKIIDRHGKLIECVNLMEFVYSESTLFNVVMSSLLICLTGFNVMAVKDLAVVVPFLQFLLMDLVEIYFLCYYGNMIIEYSMKISDAVYNCQWYRADTSIVKILMIISARAQKPCKLTALRYSDMNIGTFTRILSTSWSYFALLTSLYRE